MRKPTKRQLEVLDFINNFKKANSFSPTIREIAGHFGISVRAAYDHVGALRKKSLIVYHVGRSRTIEIVNSEIESNDSAYRSVPLLGKVSAGVPIFAEENHEYSLSLSTTLVGEGVLFALRVEGDSMIDASIKEGDIAVFSKQEMAENGQIVAARVDEAITIKRIYREKHQFRLQSENPSYSPICRTDIQVLGRLVALIRQY